MSDPTKPTDAQRLAGVLRVVAPEHHWIPYEWYLKPDIRRGNVWALDHRYFPDSLDDLARVVAMLSPEQRDRFDLWTAERTKGGSLEQNGRYPRVPASTIITAPTETWLAALVAATVEKA